MMQNEGYVRVKEAAAILGVSPNTVRAWGAAEGYRFERVKSLRGWVYAATLVCLQAFVM